MLARKGRRVVLFERETFPREHVGESLLPASIPILEELGVLPAVQAAGFLPKYGATMVWGASPEPWSWYFRETSQRNSSSFQVWRPEFDRILLENSRSAGVDVREAHRVVEVLSDGGKVRGVRVASAEGESEVLAPFVVDASGQSGVIGRALKLRRPDEQFRNLAMYGYFEGARRLPVPDETNIFIESYEHGWSWLIPLHTGWSSVGFVVDSKYGQEVIARQGLEGAFQTQLSSTSRTADMLASAKLVSGPNVIRDWSYVSDELAGDGYVLVGDAACFIDPLFSTGVHLALSAGVLGAAYVSTALNDGELGVASRAVYRDLYYQQYYLFRELARLFYASNRTVDSYFWEARRIVSGDESMAPREAFIRAAAGQPPKGYERMVLEHGVPPSGFAAGVRTVESDREARRQAVHELRTSDAGAKYFSAVPRLASGVRVERSPVLGAGEFEWGEVVRGGPLTHDLPVSGAVAAVVRLIDGRRSMADIAGALADGLEGDAAVAAARVALDASAILFVDGIVESLTSVEALKP